MQIFLSIIIPMYNESDNLNILFKKIIGIIDKINPHWEIICIDDGSQDLTYKKLEIEHENEPRIKTIKLSRNFGKEIALSAGLQHAKGQVVIPLDADLQDPPDIIPDMIEKWQEGYKVVLATRKNRDGDGWLKKFTAGMFYKLISKMSHVDIPQNTGDFRLMDKEVVDIINKLPERTRFMKGLFAWVGFSTAKIYFDRPKRNSGTTKLNFRKLWNLALDGIFAFSSIPLQVWTYCGMVISSISFIYMMYIISKTLFWGIEVPGYASLMSVMLFIGGIQLISLGIIGEYISRIYNETKQRPLYIVEDSQGFDNIIINQ